MGVEYSCCEAQFFIRIAVSIFLVIFAGLMSGLTLGLMSLSLVDLEVLAKSGTPTDRKYAEKILPVVQNQHMLLCTLLICNSAAMEALPVFLDSLIIDWGAILISVTLVLVFGEIIPQAVCSRYGLAIGAAVAPLVRVLVWICYPLTYPISKLLDLLLGKGHKALLRRAELKTLVDFHGNEAGKGGELTHDETTIIAGALELSSKTARDAMTPIAETFAIDINSKLDRNLMNLILAQGHSRIPVYYEDPGNIIGLILVKNLLTVNPAEAIEVKNITIRKIPRVSETYPLYDILNEFQKGHSHMAVVIEKSDESEPSPVERLEKVKEVIVDVTGDPQTQDKRLINLRSVRKLRSSPDATHDLRRYFSKGKKWSKNKESEILKIDEKPLSPIPEDGEAIGIITMEDVIEELLQEEIYDETDHRHGNS